MFINFPEAERKKNLPVLIDILIDCENYLTNITNKVPLRQSIRRFFNEKTFGTFE